MCAKLDEHNQNNSDPTEQCILQNEVIENTSDREDNHWILDNDMQRYATTCNGILDMKAALTCYRKVHDINSSLGNTNFENIIYLNWEKKFEEYVAYLGPKNGKKKKINKTKQKSKKIFCTSEQPGTTGRQRRCDPITERMSCLVQNTKAAEIEKQKKTFTYFLMRIYWIKLQIIQKIESKTLSLVYRG